MGVVYLARDPRVARKVAVKTYSIPSGLTADQEREFRERFLREAQAAGALNHPAIVTIYVADDDPDSRIPFIVMEYVDGRSLADLLAKRGALGVEEAFGLAQAVAEALHAAHAVGIVHRDVKPANLLIPSSGGAVKVADFGVARMASSDLTRTGLSFGSPAYMSPEQVKGEPADGRSDLFSLAVVLYEALCGARPFKGDNLTALAYAVVHMTPAPASQRRAGLPPGLDEFFERALAKEPSARFPDGLALRDALRALRNGVHGDAGEAIVLLDLDDGAAEEAALELAEPKGSTLEAVPSGEMNLQVVEPGKAALSVGGDEEDARCTAEATRGSHGARLASEETLPSPRSRLESPWAQGAEAGFRLLGRGWAWLAERRWSRLSEIPPVGGGNGRPPRPRGSNATGADSTITMAPEGRTGAERRTRSALEGSLESVTAVSGRPESARRSTRSGPRAKGTPDVRAGRRGVALPVVAGVFAVAVVLAAARTVSPDRATLIVDGRNAYRDARLTIFANGEEVYSRSLSARKKQAAILGKTLFEYGEEDFAGRIRVDSGRLEITAEVLPEGESEPRRATLVASLDPGEQRSLRITTGKRAGSPLQIDLE